VGPKEEAQNVFMTEKSPLNTTSATKFKKKVC